MKIYTFLLATMFMLIGIKIGINYVHRNLDNKADFIVSSDRKTIWVIQK